MNSALSVCILNLIYCFELKLNIIKLFWFMSDISRYITCQDFISAEPLGEGDILSWQVIYPHISLKNQNNNFITLPLSSLDDFKINHCYFKWNFEIRFPLGYPYTTTSHKYMTYILSNVTYLNKRKVVCWTHFLARLFEEYESYCSRPGDGVGVSVRVGVCVG
jgi:hypothetical protein